ncbi:MAG TPA: hypothetical protein VH720_00590 [Candidatus Limnocylindrales bacterium]|jgi:hypothetical protein
MPRPGRAVVVGLGVVALSALVFWLSNRQFDAGRGDFFYLADAFLHGRTWLDFRPGPADVIVVGDRTYVPFAPFPAIALMPVVAILGPVTADQVESGINALLAAAGLGLGWLLLGRLGVERLRDRAWLVALLGFSTAIWWVTTRGGVWHTGQLIATILTIACLAELWGRRRAALIGLLAGAAFLTRAPLAFAIPFYALLLLPATDADLSTIPTRPRVWPWLAWVLLGAGALVSLAFFLWYNADRFGSVLESGYALATLPDWLAARRDLGLFSLAHLGPNLDYLLYHGFHRISNPPFLRPDGLGLSILVTSPGLLLAARADWRAPRSWLLLGAAIAVLVPSLLYYGGGWLQYGYRYALDSIPFLFALAGLAVAQRGHVGRLWQLLIVVGVLVNAFGVYWAYHMNDPWR